MKIFLSILLSFIFFQGCKKDETPVSPVINKKISISVEDITCNDFWLTIKTENFTFPVNAEILLNQRKIHFILNSVDTTFFVDSLLPGVNYNLRLTVSEDSSNAISFRTTDTTNKSFSLMRTWFKGFNSFCYCVTIIDENDIWVGGDFYREDDTTNNIGYNALHWDGVNWDTVSFYNDYMGGQINSPIQSMISFSKNSVIYTSAVLGKWDGYKCITIGEIEKIVYKLWGTDEHNIYGVGYDGYIFHYNGKTVTRIPYDIKDSFRMLAGSPDGKTLYAGSNTDLRYNIVKIENNTAVHFLTLNTNFTPDFPSGKIFDIYVRNNNSIFLATRYGMYNIDGKGNVLKYYNLLEGSVVSSLAHISGSGNNDIVLAGTFNILARFNGTAWMRDETHYKENIRITGIDYKNNILVTVGFDDTGFFPRGALNITNLIGQ